MTSERSYRIAVKPLSIFLVLGGIGLSACAWVMRVPITAPFPFIESESLNRHLFGMASFVCVFIGVGLYLRNRVAWYALLVYLGMGVVLPAVSVLDANTAALQGFAFPIAGSVLNGCIAVGIYFDQMPMTHIECCDDGEKTLIESIRTCRNAQRPWSHRCWLFGLVSMVIGAAGINLSQLLHVNRGADWLATTVGIDFRPQGGKSP